MEESPTSVPSELSASPAEPSELVAAKTPPVTIAVTDGVATDGAAIDGAVTDDEAAVATEPEPSEPESPADTDTGVNINVDTSPQPVVVQQEPASPVREDSGSPSSSAPHEQGHRPSAETARSADLFATDPAPALVPNPTPNPVARTDMADTEHAKHSDSQPASRSASPTTASHKPAAPPKPHPADVTVAIVATVIIVLGLAFIAIYAYLKTRQ
jgi:hypothetical protein